MLVEAVDLIYAFGLEEKFPPLSLLSSFVEKACKVGTEAKREGQRSRISPKEATEKELAALKPVLKCLQDHNIDASELSRLGITQKIAGCEKKILEFERNFQEKNAKRKVEEGGQLKNQYNQAKQPRHFSAEASRGPFPQSIRSAQEQGVAVIAGSKYAYNGSYIASNMPVSAEASHGPNASILELTDSIHAAQMQEDSDDQLWESRVPSSAAAAEGTGNILCRRKKIIPGLDRKYKRHQVYDSKKDYVKKMRPINDDCAAPLAIPQPMVGFGLPFGQPSVPSRKLPDAAVGPPFFYYENVALAPKGVWETISRFLYDIQPEFVDSKFFSAAARKRGYIHNLPIKNRFPLLPIPPKTIHEAFPATKKWWPSWDTRTHLNCLQTCIASAKLTERLRSALAESDDPPPERVRKYVLYECRKWNLVWIGLHKLAVLEPDEIEMLLGFPRNHTRGISRTERYKSLGNSFQVDTVAYHLSVLKDMFPNGITVLSLFSGIGGAEVALHRLGIHLKVVVSVELSDSNRNVVRSWWDQTQTGTLIHISDVQQLNGDRLEYYINTYGGFDLVIGGSPCNNLAGSNRHHRDGLEGEHSALFYDYFRILDLVKCIMGRN